jgi:transcriptional regulator with GAF, ATPase, and Fis domain
VNCSAIPGELAESVLFGHLKGSFTGAAGDRKGCFELAQGGTLFLDEIGEMSGALQVKLLRVLEDGVVVPLGSSEGRKVQVQILAATNADLRQEVEARRFRQDLYFRLAMFVVEVPPLRERRDDIPLLVDHFVKTLSAEMGLPRPPVSTEARESLFEYDYPGNVRELRNIMERALMECEGEEIRLEHLHYFRPGPGRHSIAAADLTLPHGTPPSPPAELREPIDEEARLLAFVRARGPVTNTDCRELLKTDRHHASYLLRKMAESGQLHVEGHGRWAQYRLPQPS